MNSFLMFKDLGIAAEIKMNYKYDIMNDNDVMVKSNEIEDGIRKLMQRDSEIRRKVKDLIEKARIHLVEGGFFFFFFFGFFFFFFIFFLEVYWGFFTIFVNFIFDQSLNHNNG